MQQFLTLSYYIMSDSNGPHELKLQRQAKDISEDIYFVLTKLCIPMVT
jgi:hypothetical protein